MLGYHKRYNLYMMLILHIAIALSSVLYTGLLYMRPTALKFKVSYALVGLTVGTGTWLTVANPSHLMQSCAAGLIYLAIVFAGMAVSRRKWATSEVTNR